MKQLPLSTFSALRAAICDRAAGARSHRAARERFTLAKRPIDILHVLSAIVVTIFATSAFAKAPAQIPPLLKEVEANYAKAGTIYANFEQTSFSAAMNATKPSSGNIVIKRPNKLRWQTLKPDASLLVSDGIHAWFYTPPFDPSEQGQYTEIPASQIRSKLANALLSGEFQENSDLTIKAISDREFTLKPKPGTAGTVKEARVEIDPKSKTVVRVQLTHSDGNRADIHLNEIKLGDKYGDDVFVFKPPPGTQKMDQ